MKKLLAALLAAAMLLSLTACGNNDKPDETPDNSANVTDQETPDQDTPEQDTSAPDVEEPVYVPIDVLTTIWANYPEDAKFPAAGGEVMDGPGVLTGDYASAEYIDNLIAVPQAEAEKISEPACLMHMMNANTFTCGAYTVDAADIEAITKSVNDNIMSRQWICGFPDKMFVATIGNCVIDAFGNAEIMDQFKTTLTSLYPDTVFVYESNIE